MTPGKPGYFASVIADRKVAGPVITTQSEFDTAVGRLYPLAAGVARQVSFAPGELPKYGAVGTFGLRGPGAEIVDLAAAERPRRSGGRGAGGGYRPAGATAYTRRSVKGRIVKHIVLGLSAFSNRAWREPNPAEASFHHESMLPKDYVVYRLR